MPKLQLKSKKKASTAKRTSKHKDNECKAGQSQSKLFHFFESSQESPKDTVTDESPRVEMQHGTEIASKYFKTEDNVKSDDDKDASFKDFKPDKIKKGSKIDLERKQSKEKIKKNKNTKKSANKKDNLIEYTTEFEKVCSAGGVDVNPEHLQLAIAMSLSLTNNNKHQNEGIDEDFEVPSTEPSFSHEEDKVKRIRRTLKEYGFKVPLGPICTNPNKRRRPRKYEKSLLITRPAEEKQQILTNAVSKIIFEEHFKNVANKSDQIKEINSTILNDVWCRNCAVFSKRSLEFKHMLEEDEIFYVNNLITPSNAKPGCLLKDWSKIPGRDPSPERIKESLDFRDHELYCKDFDALLSSCYSYIHNRVESIKSRTPSPKKSVSKTNIDTIQKSVDYSNKIDNVKEILFVDSRSCSPELFGENSYYGEGFSKPVDTKMEKETGPSEEIKESSNDSLPDVYVSQMSLQKRPFQLNDNEVISVDDSEITISKNLRQCSIDLTLNESDSNESKTIKEPLFIDETASEDSDTDDKDLSKENFPTHFSNFDSLNKKAVEDIGNDLDDSNINCQKVNVQANDKDLSEVTVKRKIASLGSIEDTFRFEEALNEYKITNPVPNTDNTTDSVDLTAAEDGDDVNTNDDAFGKSFAQRCSQIYKNDNGVLHYESYDENGTFMDISETSTPEKNYVTQRNVNVHNMSKSYADDDENAKCNNSQNNLFSKSNESNISADIFDNKDGLTTRLATKSKRSIKSTRSRDLHNLSDSVLHDCLEIDQYENDNCEFINKTDTCLDNFDSLGNIENCMIMNEQKSSNVLGNDPEKEIDLTQTSNESIEIPNHVNFVSDCKPNSTNHVINKADLNRYDSSEDVFVISDEEFNYSISNSVKTVDKRSINTNYNAISESDDDGDKNVDQRFKINDELATNDDLSKPVSSNCDYDIPNDFDLYGSSIFDQIPSCLTSRISGFSKRNSNEKSARISSVLDEFPSVMPSCSTVKSKRKSSITKTRSMEIKTSKSNLDVKNRLAKGSIDDETVEQLTKQRKSLDIREDVNKAKLQDGIITGIDEFIKSLENTKITPKSDKFMIKVNNVTPALDYQSMDTPQVHKELSRFGLKPLKRKRAIQILEHIYNRTHPLIDSKELETKIKRRKLVQAFQKTSSPVAKTSKEKTPEKIEQEADFLNEDNKLNTKAIPCTSNDLRMTTDIYNVDRFNVGIKSVDCDKEEWFFQTREKSKIHSCRVPLHVAFHNYVSLRSKLQEAILTYHPVHIDAIHKGLVADGYRYNPKDLFQFMDKKCITIKTTDKNGGSRQKKR